MSSVELEHFGAMLIERVRDTSIDEMKDRVIHSKNGPISKELNRIAVNRSLSDTEKLLAIIPVAVDYAMDNFLWMLEDERIFQLLFKDPETGNQVDINAISDGLSGEIFTDEGWINRFSKAGKIDY